jgi:hypothetical protein
LTSVVTISAVAGWNFSQNRNEVALSDMALENIEALADESGCNYTNGYRLFKEGNSHAYDCCQIWRREILQVFVYN